MKVVVDFSQSNETTLDFAHVFQPGEIDLNDEAAKVSGALEVAGKAHRNGETADVSGRIAGKLEVGCHRCLNPLEIAVDIEFADSFVTLARYEEAKSEHEITGADLDVSIYDGEKIDIGELVREQILLNLPTQALCSENCAGLCEKCGANRNSENCRCEHEEIDPRWDALRELKNRN